MTLQADLIADRRKMRRRLSLWRVLGVLGAIVGVVGLGYAFGGRQALPISSDHVAKIRIEGVITGDDRTLRLIKEVREAVAQGVRRVGVPLAEVALAGADDPVAALLLCQVPRVRHSVVQGRVLVRDGVPTTLDLPALVRRQRAQARQLLA